MKANEHKTTVFCDECNEDTTHTIIFESLNARQKKVYFLTYCDTCMAKFGEETNVYRMETSIHEWKEFLIRYHHEGN